jgi:hypothetical protein
MSKTMREFDDEEMRKSFFTIKNPKFKAQHEQVAAAFYDLARLVRDLSPHSYQADAALTSLLTASFFTHAAIAQGVPDA